jgi:hypothetical protein
MLQFRLYSKHSLYAKNICCVNDVAHDPANPNFYIDITNFSLSIGTQNGDSGIVNLNFAGTQIATLTGNYK